MFSSVWTECIYCLGETVVAQEMIWLCRWCCWSGQWNLSFYRKWFPGILLYPCMKWEWVIRWDCTLFREEHSRTFIWIDSNSVPMASILVSNSIGDDCWMSWAKQHGSIVWYCNIQRVQAFIAPDHANDNAQETQISLPTFFSLTALDVQETVSQIFIIIMLG